MKTLCLPAKTRSDVLWCTWVVLVIVNQETRVMAKTIRLNESLFWHELWTVPQTFSSGKIISYRFFHRNWTLYWSFGSFTSWGWMMEMKIISIKKLSGITVLFYRLLAGFFTAASNYLGAGFASSCGLDVCIILPSWPWQSPWKSNKLLYSPSEEIDPIDQTTESGLNLIKIYRIFH